MIEEILFSAMRLSVPLILAAYGGLLSERSGIANIALESYLLFSAFTAAAVTALSGNLVLGVAAGVGAAALASFLFAVVCIYGRGDQIVIGTGFNLLAAGLIPVMSTAFFDIAGSTPALSTDLRFQNPEYFFLAAIVFLIALEFLFRKTRHGLRITAAGESPDSLTTQGVRVSLVRMRAIVEGGVIAGLGGVYLSMCQGSGFIRDMSAGRGFIALAALIFGAWRPLPTFLACMFFALTDAIQIQLQGKAVNGIEIPNQFVQIIPYVATLIVLIFAAQKMRAPAAINRP